MPLRDVTEYQFATATRRLLVRNGEPASSLEIAAARYQENLKRIFGARNVRRGEPESTRQGATAIVVTAGVAADSSSTVRTAFLQFVGGPLSEITLEAPATDRQAAGEFRRLIESAQASRRISPELAVAEAIEAGPVGRASHPAGPVRLDLTDDYRSGDRFTLASQDGAVRYYLESGGCRAGSRRARAGRAV
jgi:hypothetical protein